MDLEPMRGERFIADSASTRGKGRNNLGHLYVEDNKWNLVYVVQSINIVFNYERIRSLHHILKVGYII